MSGSESYAKHLASADAMKQAQADLEAAHVLHKEANDAKNEVDRRQASLMIAEALENLASMRRAYEIGIDDAGKEVTVAMIEKAEREYEAVLSEKLNAAVRAKDYAAVREIAEGLEALQKSLSDRKGNDAGETEEEAEEQPPASRKQKIERTTELSQSVLEDLTLLFGQYNVTDEDDKTHWINKMYRMLQEKGATDSAVLATIEDEIKKDKEAKEIGRNHPRVQPVKGFGG